MPGDNVRHLTPPPHPPPRCGYRESTGRVEWVCEALAHPHTPDQHYMVNVHPDRFPPTDPVYTRRVRSTANERHRMTKFAHLATRDEVLASRTGSLSYYSATGESGGSYEVLGPVPGNPDAVYVQSRRLKLLAVALRVGVKNVRGKGEQVRVRIYFADDTGDAAGTLAFGGNKISGVAPRVLFSHE